MYYIMFLFNNHYKFYASLRYKYKFWSDMFNIVKRKNIRLELEIEKNKRTIEDLNKKLNEVNINTYLSRSTFSHW